MSKKLWVSYVQMQLLEYQSRPFLRWRRALSQL